MTKQITVGLSRGMLILSVRVGIEDGVEDKAPHNSCKTLLVGLPLQEEGTQIGEANGVPIS